MADPRDGTFRRPDDAATERLDRALRALRPDLSWAQLRHLITRGKVLVGSTLVVDPGAPVGAGTEIRIQVDRASPRGLLPVQAVTLAPDRIVFRDRFLVVVDKPPGLDTIPYVAKTRAGAPGRRDAVAVPTLDRLLAAALGAPVRVVHRLDRDTSGLLMFARTAEAEGKLAHQLRRHTVHRRYLALVHGDVRPATLRSFLAEDRGDGLRGSVGNRRLGKEAITHVEVVERLRGATLVACRLETGRTHQIRIHLAEAGHMLLGERGYVRAHAGATIAAPRIMLHAAELGFAHPIEGTDMRFSLPMPADMQAACQALAAEGAPPDGDAPISG